MLGRGTHGEICPAKHDAGSRASSACRKLGELSPAGVCECDEKAPRWASSLRLPLLSTFGASLGQAHPSGRNVIRTASSSGMICSTPVTCWRNPSVGPGGLLSNGQRSTLWLVTLGPPASKLIWARVAHSSALTNGAKVLEAGWLPDTLGADMTATNLESKPAGVPGQEDERPTARNNLFKGLITLQAWYGRMVSMMGAGGFKLERSCRCHQPCGPNCWALSDTLRRWVWAVSGHIACSL